MAALALAQKDARLSPRLTDRFSNIFEAYESLIAPAVREER